MAYQEEIDDFITPSDSYIVVAVTVTTMFLLTLTETVPSISYVDIAISRHRFSAYELLENEEEIDNFVTYICSKPMCHAHVKYSVKK